MKITIDFHSHRDMNGDVLKVKDYVIMSKKNSIVFGRVTQLRVHDIQVIQAQPQPKIAWHDIRLNKTSIQRTDQLIRVPHVIIPPEIHEALHESTKPRITI